MRVLTHTRSFASVLLGLALLAEGAQAGSQRWLGAETENFVILSDARTRDVERVARSLEGLQAVLERMEAVERQGPKTVVYAFRNTPVFNGYYHGRGGSGVAGFFTGSPLRNYLAIDLARDRAGSTVYHELLHEFAAINFPSVPLWFNEGLAEYYSTFFLNGDVAEIGRPVEAHVRWLHTEALLPMRWLLEVTTESADYNEGSRGGTFYAQSWAAVHYLLSSDERAEGLRRFLQASESGEVAAEAFETAFELEPEAFDRELERYVRGRSFQFSRVPVEREALELTVEQVEQSRALVLLGELLVAQSDVPTALSLAQLKLSEALAMEGVEPQIAGQPAAGAIAKPVTEVVGDAMGLLGKLAWEHGDLERARALFELGSMAPSSVVPRLYRGLNELEVAMEQVIEASRAVDNRSAEVAQRSLREVLELEPSFALARVSFGMTYLYLGDPAEGLTILEQVVQDQPGSINGWLGIALLSAKQGDFDRAWRLLGRLDVLAERLPHEFDPELMAAGRTNVAAFHLNHAIDLANRGEDQAALNEMASLEQRLNAVERESLAASIRAVRSTAEYNLTVDRYNDIVMLAQRGRYRTALEQLEMLIAGSDLSAIDESLLLQAEDLRDKLRAALR